MHECLAVIDLASEQSESMKQVFQQAVRSTAFLGSPEVSVICYVLVLDCLYICLSVTGSLQKLVMSFLETFDSG